LALRLFRRIVGLSVKEARVQVTSGSILYRHGRHGATRTFLTTKVADTRERSIQFLSAG